MIIRGMNLPLIIACIIIVLALIILPLIVSYKAEKRDIQYKSKIEAQKSLREVSKVFKSAFILKPNTKT